METRHMRFQISRLSGTTPPLEKNHPFYSKLTKIVKESTTYFLHLASLEELTKFVKSFSGKFPVTMPPGMGIFDDLEIVIQDK